MLMSVLYTIVRTCFKVRMCMLYTRGFLQVYSTAKVFSGPQIADNYSYPRFFCVSIEHYHLIFLALQHRRNFHICKKQLKKLNI